MTPNDIIVGRMYTCEAAKGAVFMGIGFRKMWTGIFDNTCEMEHKHLVIVHDKKSEFIGLVLKEGEDCQEGFWDSLHII
jgi:hypothetical protein